MLAVVLALCWFVVVIAHQWVAHMLPSSPMVLVFSFVGMSIVGAWAGFVISALANIAFRAGRPAMRVLLAAFVWTIFCGGLMAWLLHTGADRSRLFPLSGLAAFWGLLVGPYNAEFSVSYWLVRRGATGPQNAA
jgi:FtsH-binding integral membrane protein